MVSRIPFEFTDAVTRLVAADWCEDEGLREMAVWLRKIHTSFIIKGTHLYPNGMAGVNSWESEIIERLLRNLDIDKRGMVVQPMPEPFRLSVVESSDHVRQYILVRLDTMEVIVEEEADLEDAVASGRPIKLNECIALVINYLFGNKYSCPRILINPADARHFGLQWVPAFPK
jgi:hypothetical protein